MLCRFGDFTMDVDTRRLLRLGQDVHLTTKAFDLLNLLLDNQDRAVSKAELRQKIWPSTFVEETNLASLVAEIRRALSDTEWIRTVYGFGYQFVGPVSREASPLERDSSRLWLMVERRPIPPMEGVNVIGRAPDATIQLGLRHDGAFRTSVGIVNLDDMAQEFTVVVAGERHSERMTISVPSYSLVQTGVPDQSYGSLALKVIAGPGAGPWTAYGSSVDNSSGDAWAAVAKPLPE